MPAAPSLEVTTARTPNGPVADPGGTVTVKVTWLPSTSVMSPSLGRTPPDCRYPPAIVRPGQATVTWIWSPAVTSVPLGVTESVGPDPARGRIPSDSTPSAAPAIPAARVLS